MGKERRRGHTERRRRRESSGATSSSGASSSDEYPPRGRSERRRPGRRGRQKRRESSSSDEASSSDDHATEKRSERHQGRSARRRRGLKPSRHGEDSSSYDSTSEVTSSSSSDEPEWTSWSRKHIRSELPLDWAGKHTGSKNWSRNKDRLLRQLRRADIDFLTSDEHLVKPRGKPRKPRVELTEPPPVRRPAEAATRGTTRRTVTATPAAARTTPAASRATPEAAQQWLEDAAQTFAAIGKRATGMTHRSERLQQQLQQRGHDERVNYKTISTLSSRSLHHTTTLPASRRIQPQIWRRHSHTHNL